MGHTADAPQDVFRCVDDSFLGQGGGKEYYMEDFWGYMTI